MKNPFSKSSITDTLINVGLGGAANAAMDYAVANVDALASIAGYANYIKLGVGVLGGSMIKGKVARAAFDGLATVGASDIIKELITPEAADPTKKDTAPIPGVPFIGRVRAGQRGFVNRRGVRGTGTVPFMG